MRILKILAACLLLAAPTLVHAGLRDGDLPAASTWYFHADLAEMRASAAASSIWVWLNDELFDELEEETGIDLSKDADLVTAFATGEAGVVMVLEGRFSQQTQDKVLAISADADTFEQKGSRGRIYYYVNDDGDADRDGGRGSNVEVDGFDNGAFISFSVRNRFIVTSTEATMRELIANNGRITGQRSHDGALFVLTAEKSLIQAGADAEIVRDDDDEGGFDSNILRNTRKVAFMIADVAGKIAVEAQLVAKEPAMAESLASIVRGLIALQALSDKADSEVAEALRNTTVDVKDNILKLSVTLSPQVVKNALDEV